MNIYQRLWTFFHCLVAHLLGNFVHGDKFQCPWISINSSFTHLWGLKMVWDKFQDLLQWLFYSFLWSWGGQGYIPKIESSTMPLLHNSSTLYWSETYCNVHPLTSTVFSHVSWVLYLSTIMSITPILFQWLWSNQHSEALTFKKHFHSSYSNHFLFHLCSL